MGNTNQSSPQIRFNFRNPAQNVALPYINSDKPAKQRSANINEMTLMITPSSIKPSGVFDEISYDRLLRHAAAAALKGLFRSAAMQFGLVIGRFALVVYSAKFIYARIAVRVMTQWWLTAFLLLTDICKCERSVYQRMCLASTVSAQ